MSQADENENQNIDTPVGLLMRKLERQDSEIATLEEEIEKQKEKNAKLRENKDSVSKEQQLQKLKEKKATLKTQVRQIPRSTSDGDSEINSVRISKISKDIRIQRNRKNERALTNAEERLAKLKNDKDEILRRINGIRKEIDKARASIDKDKMGVCEHQRRLDRAKKKLDQFREDLKRLEQRRSRVSRNRAAPQTLVCQNPLTFFNTVNSQLGTPNRIGTATASSAQALPLQNEKTAIKRDCVNKSRLNEAVEEVKRLHLKLKGLGEMIGDSKDVGDKISSIRASESDSAEQETSSKRKEPFVLDIYLPASSESVGPDENDKRQSPAGVAQDDQKALKTVEPDEVTKRQIPPVVAKDELKVLIYKPEPLNDISLPSEKND